MGGIRTTFEFYVAPFDEYNKKRSDLECIGGVSVLLNTWGGLSGAEVIVAVQVHGEAFR